MSSLNQAPENLKPQKGSQEESLRRRSIKPSLEERSRRNRRAGNAEGHELAGLRKRGSQSYCPGRYIVSRLDQRTDQQAQDKTSIENTPQAFSKALEERTEALVPDDRRASGRNRAILIRSNRNLDPIYGGRVCLFDRFPILGVVSINPIGSAKGVARERWDRLLNILLTRRPHVSAAIDWSEEWFGKLQRSKSSRGKRTEENDTSNPKAHAYNSPPRGVQVGTEDRWRGGRGKGIERTASCVQTLT